ncbi:MAG: hypothetical protein JNL28_09900 [Planctomycetes bacterium]|nr:hypothetical protein [Planctomycetota bacterium]
MTILSCIAGLCLATNVRAAEIFVTADIAVSTTWTADNTYNLQQQIYVLPGATLTIEPGTVVASTTGLGGSLAVARGAQIFVNGTESAPVIMTSKADVATWVGGNPKAGIWREAVNEWGNLTIMGRAYISENAIVGNTPAPNASNVASMEGLVAAFPGDTKVLYGGGDDDDDSGSIRYLSLRYGGKVVALNNELNGLSLGGVGRGTDIDHIDIMNNVDDGIEIWGGTVNLKYVNIWNVGDDSLDVDQGWRGKAQYGLIVQGYSADASQGSGVGDNVFEMDGAEQSDYQPVTTSTIYNFTVIGQPAPGAGDHAMAFRDNARVQFRNCIFMDLGDRLVSFDNIDGDGGQGYGFNGTLSWANTWTTPFSSTSTVNAPANPASFYTVQTSGNLIEVTDSVMFRNLSAAAYTEANNRSVFAAANNNVLIASTLDADAPIQAITRGAPVVKGGLTMLPVTFLDPRPKNAALASVGSAPNDGFFTAAGYRGGFAPRQTWLAGWTASFAFGFTPGEEQGTSFCIGDGSGAACPCANNGTAGNGCANSSFASGARLIARGFPGVTNATDSLVLTAVNIPGPGLFFQGTGQFGGGNGIPFGDGLLCAGGTITRMGVVFPSGNAASYPGGLTPNPIHVAGAPIALGDVRHYQCWYRDAAVFCSAATYNLTQGLTITWQP